MDSALFKAILPQRKQFMHLCCSFTRWNSSETDSLPSVGRLLNDIGVFFFILPRVPNSAPSQSVKFSNRVLRYGLLFTLFVNPFQSISIRANLLCISVSQLLVAIPDGS